jgi:hypothetical protein
MKNNRLHHRSNPENRRDPYPLLSWLFTSIKFVLGLEAKYPGTLSLHLTENLDKKERFNLLPALLGIEASIPGSIPESLIKKDPILRISIGARNIKLLHAFAPLASEYEKRQIRWAALKGVDHLARFYPSLAWRKMDDIDILVHPDDLYLAISILRDAGAKLLYPNISIVCHALPFTYNGIHLDLHKRLNNLGTGCISTESLLEGAYETLLLNSVPIRLMPLSNSFVAHSLLLAKDHFLAKTTKSIRIVELALLNEFVEYEALQSWQEPIRQAGALKAFSKSRELVRWIQEGLKPIWIDPDLGTPESFKGPQISQSKALIENFKLQDNIWRSLRFLLLNLGISAIRGITFKRYGSIKLSDE